MTHQVQFPNLGISVEVNPIAFQVGNFTIYWYGIIIGIGFLFMVLPPRFTMFTPFFFFFMRRPWRS